MITRVSNGELQSPVWLPPRLEKCRLGTNGAQPMHISHSESPSPPHTDSVMAHTIDGCGVYARMCRPCVADHSFLSPYTYIVGRRPENQLTRSD